MTSLPDLSLAKHHPLIRRQFLQPAWTPSMIFIGADANFGPQAEFIAVVEPRAGVDHHRRAIDALRKFAGRRQVARDDCVGMPRAITVDVLDRLGQRIDDFDRNDWSQEL